MSLTPTLQRFEHPDFLRADRPPGLVRRVIAVLMVLIGITLMGLTLVNNLFKVGPAFERLTDGFRPVLTQQAIAADRRDIAGLAAAGTEFQTKLGPALATQLQMTPAQLQTMMATQFPAVAAGVTALPTAVPTFNGLVTTLDQQRPLFRSADAIPTKDLPATTLPWSLLAAGLLVTALGVYTWFAPRTGSVVAVALGALLIAAPLVMSLPQKASDADQMNTNLKPVYTQQLITQADGAITTLSAMGSQMQAAMLPALATQLKMTPAQMQSFLGQNFPATTASLSEMPGSLQRFNGLVGTFRTHLPDYKTLKPVELVPIVWTMIGGGIALMLIGLVGTFLPQRLLATSR